MKKKPRILCLLPQSLFLLAMFALLAGSAAAQTNPAPGEVPPPPIGQAGAQTGAQAATPSIPIPPPEPPVSMPAPPPPPPPPPPMVEAPAPPVPAVPPKATMSSKFSAEIYGFAEFDAILDSTESYNEIAGNAVLKKSGTFAGDHSRLTYSARNSRIGFKFKGPDTELIHTSGIAEADFLGNQPPNPPLTEAAFLTNPTFRIRHMALKLETPFVDVLAGQSWQLFGWQGYFFPNSVEIMGLPGQVFGRAPQLRISHPFKTEAVTVELALASSRSPQRDSGIPDTQGGIRLLINKWKALHTANSTGTAVDSGGIGVSGVLRRFRVNEFAATTDARNSRTGSGISVDALIPVIPATVQDHANALTLTGSFVRGSGIADLFTGLTGGIGYPALAANAMGVVPTYTPNIDPGLVTYVGPGDLHTINWQSFMFGFQYYLPPTGSVWISGNYSQMDSNNIDSFTPASGAVGAVVKRSQFADGNLFWDVNKAVRFGVEFAWFKQKFVDDSTAKNYRGQFSTFYLF